MNQPPPETRIHVHIPLIGFVGQHVGLVAWRSGNALCPINEVAPRRSELVFGWVNACGQVNHLGMYYVTSDLGHLSLPSICVGK